jgi:zinc and cadmium transporter
MIIVLYCLAIAAVSLLGGYLPLTRRITHLNLQVYLSLCGGAMLGASFFHMLPHSAELAGPRFGWWLALGVIGLYMMERFLSPHSHDTSAVPESDHDAHHHHAAAPQVAGWSAVAGLSIHTLLGGVALGSAVLGEDTPKGLGLAVFLATVLHKPADSLTISTLLVKGGIPARRIWVVQCIFAMLIPLGVVLFDFGRAVLMAHLDTAFTGCVLAFSAGTFICIALSDLLPEVQFHSHDRGRLFLAVVLGALLMGATSLLEPSHAHGTGHESPPTHREGDRH